MTEAPQTSANVPQWTLGDRMKKAREHAGLKQAELAERTGISRASISNYEIDKFVPSRPALLAWALATGVPLAWISDGEESPTPPSPGTFTQFDGGVSHRSLRPRKHTRFALISPSPLTTGIAA